LIHFSTIPDFKEDETAVAMERLQLTSALWRHTTVEEMIQAVFSVGPLPGYTNWPTVFCWATECSAVEV
jgi:hypothetical protein